jgi:DNA-formamidopyrimidine glycosylase
MPESAEAKRIAELLAEKVSSKKLTSVDILSGRYTKKEPDGFVAFKDITPINAIGAGVHGKFIYIILEGGSSIWSTLGMTGYWSETKTKHARLALHFDNDVLYFNDARNFGTIKFVGDKNELIKKLQSLGPDMATSNITDNELKERLTFMRSNKTIAQAIMDQNVIAGIGNYIKSESLYRARISPHRLISDLKDEEFSALNTSIKYIIGKSYNLKSKMTMRDFDNYNDPKYNIEMSVYSKKEDIYGHEVIKEKTKDGRNTYWVPQVQK